MDISKPDDIYDNGYKEWYIKGMDYRPLDKPDRETGNHRDWCYNSKRGKKWI